jgi:hypothetical protein
MDNNRGVFPVSHISPSSTRISSRTSALIPSWCLHSEHTRQSFLVIYIQIILFVTIILILIQPSKHTENCVLSNHSLRVPIPFNDFFFILTRRYQIVPILKTPKLSSPMSGAEAETDFPQSFITSFSPTVSTLVDSQTVQLINSDRFLGISVPSLYWES